jgi:hypothetical protein
MGADDESSPPSGGGSMCCLLFRLITAGCLVRGGLGLASLESSSVAFFRGFVSEMDVVGNDWNTAWFNK